MPFFFIRDCLLYCFATFLLFPMDIHFSSCSVSRFLFHTTCRAFGSTSSTSLSEEIHLIHRLYFFLYSLLLWTAFFSDYNGHLVLNLPLTHTHPRCLSVLFLFICVCLAVFLCSYYTGAFGRSSIGWCVNLSACNWHFSGNWVQRGDCWLKGETVTLL